MSGTTPEILKFSHIEKLLSGAPIELKGQWIEVEVPRFQRGYVWAEPRRKSLVKSIRDGLPIGCIVLCKSASRVDNLSRQITTYQLVDGLQRSITIAASTKNPYLWATENQIADEVIDRNVVAALLASSQASPDIAKATALILEFIKTNQEHPELINTGHLWDFLRSGMAMNRDAGQEEWRQLQMLIHGIESNLSIKEYEIPALLYTGPIENASTIFELLNQQGQKLSPYQVYAAGWIKDKVTLDSKVTADQLVLALVKEREVAMQDAGYLLEGAREHSLFDALNALGHIWSRKYPHLLSQAKIGSESSIGFQAAALFYGVKTTDKSKMHNLPTRFPRKADQSIDLFPFVSAIENALRMLDLGIGRYLRFNFRAKHTKSDTSLLSDLQVVSLVVWLAQKFGAEKTTPCDYLTRRLIVDAVNKEWEGGPIDALAFNNVWVSESGESLELAGTYAEPIPDSEWESELTRWFQGQLKERTRKRKSATRAQKLILKLIAATNMNFAEEQEEFEVDHLFSVKSCQDAFKSKTEEWPINAISNLGVLVVRSNREKSAKSIHNWYHLPEPRNADAKEKQDWQRRRKQSLRSLGVELSALEVWDVSELSLASFTSALKKHWELQLKVLKNV